MTRPAIPEVMPAVVQDRYGDYLASVLSLGEAPVPRPGPGQVLVRVETAGVNRGVWHLATGRPYAVRLALGLARPRQAIPGMELAGTVVALGEGVTDLEVQVQQEEGHERSLPSSPCSRGGCCRLCLSRVRKGVCPV